MMPIGTEIMKMGGQDGALNTVKYLGQRVKRME
jgi:hypothetical protein